MSKTVQFDQIVLPHEQFKALQMDIANEMFEAVYSDRTDEQYIRDKAGNLSLTETAQDCFNSLFDAAEIILTENDINSVEYIAIE
jgi:hypothetical protein